MQYLWYEELDEAKAQSRSKWADKIGHPKRPEDVTEYIWSWHSPPDKTYYVLAIHENEFHLLSPAEMGDLMPESDPLVVACFVDSTIP